MGAPNSKYLTHLLYLPLLAATPVLGDDINCQTVIGAETVDDNLVIAAPCTLNGTTVEGNIRIFTGGSLTAIGAVIDGNIEADTADFVAIQNTEVDGRIKLDSMVGDLSYIRDSAIDGKISLKNNRSRLEMQGNFIDDDLIANENIGGVFIGDNIIEGDLECKKNSPEPVGDNNFVSGKTKNQCRDLEAPQITEDPGSGEEPDDSGSGEPPVDADVAAGPPPTNLTPPGELNTGTGGGASAGPALVAFLLATWLLRSRRRIFVHN